MAITDFVEKYRSLAVFGGIVGALLLAGLIAIYQAIDRDDVDAAKLTQQQIVRDQDGEIKDLQAAIAKRKARLEVLPRYRETERQAQAAEIEVAAAGGQVSGLRAGNAALRKVIDTLQAEFAAYQDHYRQFARTSAKGEQLGTLNTASGKSFDKVVIAEVDAVGVRIIHAEGKTRIPYPELPATLQDRFQFDAAQRDALLARENTAGEAHSAAADAATAAQQIQRGQVNETEKAQRKAETERALAEKATELARVNAELLQLARALAEEQQRTTRNTEPIKARISAKQQQRAQIQAAIVRLQSNP